MKICISCGHAKGVHYLTNGKDGKMRHHCMERAGAKNACACKIVDSPTSSTFRESVSYSKATKGGIATSPKERPKAFNKFAGTWEDEDFYIERKKG